MYNFFLFLSSFRQWKNVNYCLLLPKERKDSMAISSFLKLQKRLFHQAEFNFPLCSRMVKKKKNLPLYVWVISVIYVYILHFKRKQTSNATQTYLNSSIFSIHHPYTILSENITITLTTQTSTRKWNYYSDLTVKD